MFSSASCPRIGPPQHWRHTLSSIALDIRTPAELRSWCIENSRALANLSLSDPITLHFRIASQAWSLATSFGLVEIAGELAPGLYGRFFWSLSKRDFVATIQHELVKMIAWCNAQQGEQVYGWETQPGQFRFRGGQWHPLPGGKAPLLQAFINARNGTLTSKRLWT